MPIQEICVYPSNEKHLSDDTADNAETKAMLQSIVTTSPSVNNQPSLLSSPSFNNDICRICHCEAEVHAPLIAPCFCSGSLRYVHQACLQQWIKSADTSKCELCKYEFIMNTKIKPFLKWEKLEMSSVERRKIFCSVTFHLVAITCVVWSLYVLIERTAEEIRAGQLEWPFWTKLIVVAIGFTGGLVFMYVQCKMYVQLCRRWKAFNRIIFVQDAPAKSAHVSQTVNNQTSSTTHVASDPSGGGFSSSKADSCMLSGSIDESQGLNPLVSPVVASKLTLPLVLLSPQLPSSPCTVLPPHISPHSNSQHGGPGFVNNNNHINTSNNNNNNNSVVVSDGTATRIDTARNHNTSGLETVQRIT